jgi:hypothetical protein
MQRRTFIHQSSLITGGLALSWDSARAQGVTPSPRLQIAPFRFSVTPPMGHSLCGGWIQPATVIEDPLEAIGFVLLGAGQPIVVCSVDWTGILNEAHVAWRRAMAEAAGTRPERVAVQCVHQHDAPFACLGAQRIVASQGNLPDIVDLAFFESCLQAAGQAVRQAMAEPVDLTGVAVSQAAVEQVASNRRIVDLSGKVTSQRGSSSKDPLHWRLPEGLIDPYLKTIAFYSQQQKVVACHYYACHPMSHYGRGAVSADFCGLARKKRQAEDPGCTQLYFNGCGGNIGAGKYNDGSPERRLVLSERMHEAMLRSEDGLKPQPIADCRWATEEILPQPRGGLNADEIMQQIADRSRSVVQRNRPAYTVAWLQRLQQEIPIVLSALHVNDASMLHLPAECYVEYQLRAQASAPDRFVACAAYGDGGPWYIPTAAAYPEGGYSVGMAWCDPSIDSLLSQGMARLLL